MSIRRAELSDVDRLIELYEIIHSTYEDTEDPFDEESIEDFIKSTIDCQSSEILVSEVDGEIIGFCTFFIFPLFFNQNIKHSTILTLWVDPSKRGSGAGKCLLEECERISIERGANKLITGIHRTHIETQKYFERAGHRMLDIVFLKEVN